MDIRETAREDKAYALAGIFSIHLTLAYGEMLKSCERLLLELAIQKGDLSFLSFQTTSDISHHYLSTIRETNYLIAKCIKVSAAITVSHLGTCFEVEIVKKRDASKILQKLNGWKNLKFANGRFSGLEELIEAAERLENQNSPYVELAIVTTSDPSCCSRHTMKFGRQEENDLSKSVIDSSPARWKKMSLKGYLMRQMPNSKGSG